MERFEGVANTLFVPLVARIAISKEFPEYFVDEKALELERYLPDNAARGSSQYTNMVSAARYYGMDWTREVDASLPTLMVVSGVFQYFHEEQVAGFIRSCGKVFPEAEMIFDATSTSGLRFTNWFIRRTGNENALMYFGVDDAGAFAERCGAELLE